MTAQASIPLKWYVPFAQGDSSRVELPVTTADPTRASQTLGFPPLTMQPPESGGVPPQGEDFNGGMNQVARICWWILNGGQWQYDATFATNSNINGYPKGAYLQGADSLGNWINTADNNQNNPDTNGTNWVPGFQYGTTALAGLTGGMVTPTPAQAAKNSITLAGTLGSALTVILPTWTKNWTITNSTTGAFVTIVKTAAGSGVTIPQNGSPTRVSGDGTNIVQPSDNAANASSATNVLTLAQQAGVIAGTRNLRASVTTAGNTVTLTASEIAVKSALGGPSILLSGFSATLNLATSGIGGVVGSALVANKWANIYAAWGAGATPNVFATDGSTTNPEIAASLPASYTHVALIAVWPLNGSTQLIVATATDRKIVFANFNVLSTSSTPVSPTLQSVASVVPPAARLVKGYCAFQSTTTTSTISFAIGGDTPLIDVVSIQGIGQQGFPYEIMIRTAQTLYWQAQNSAGTFGANLFVCGYTF